MIRRPQCLCWPIVECVQLPEIDGIELSNTLPIPLVKRVDPDVAVTPGGLGPPPFPPDRHAARLRGGEALSLETAYLAVRESIELRHRYLG